MKIKKDSILLLILFQLVFLRFPYLSVYSNIKRIIIILLFPLTLMWVKKIPKDYKKNNVTLLLYLLFVLISGIINRDSLITTHPLIGSITYILSLFEFYIILLNIKQKQNNIFIVNNLFVFILVYILINDLLMIINLNIFGHYYFIGDKFDVSYMHLMCFTFYLLKDKINNSKKKNNIFIKYIFIMFIIFMFIKINCVTGIIGFVIFYFIITLLNKRKNINPKLFIISLLAGGLFIFMVDNFLQFSFVQKIITDFLHKDLTLTGRLTIYENIPRMLDNHLLFGHGYGSSYEIWMKLIHYPNSQNGLIDCIIEQGLLAVILLIYNSIKVLKGGKELYPLYTLIIVFNILSSIEITINLSYVSLIVLFYVLANESEKKDEKNKCHSTCI